MIDVLWLLALFSALWIVILAFTAQSCLRRICLLEKQTGNLFGRINRLEEH